MVSILDDNDDMGFLSHQTSTSNLLSEWVTEQTSKLTQILRQLNTINDLPDYKLNELCNYLDDIDFHISGLANILSLVCNNENELALNETNNNVPRKWALVHALWFHMIMVTDPDSIYYSSRLGKPAWPINFTPENAPAIT